MILSGLPKLKNGIDLKWLFVNVLNNNVLSEKGVQKRLLYSLLPIRSRLFSSLYLHHKIFDN